MDGMIPYESPRDLIREVCDVPGWKMPEKVTIPLDLIEQAIAEIDNAQPLK